MARTASILLLAACLAPLAMAIPPYWVTKHAQTCSENLPLGGHFPSETLGHGAAGPVALDPTLSFLIVDSTGKAVNEPICQGQEVGVVVLFGNTSRAFLLTASDNAVEFLAVNGSQPSVGPNSKDPLNCTNRVYTHPTAPGDFTLAPPLVLPMAMTGMIIPCGAGPITLTITTAKGRGMQHLQATHTVQSKNCGCTPKAAATTPAAIETSTGAGQLETSTGAPTGLELSGAPVPESPAPITPAPTTPAPSTGILTPSTSPAPTPSTITPAPSPRQAGASSVQASMLLGVIMTVLALAL